MVTRTSLTLGYVPGATPAKWARIWAQRRPEVPLELRAVTAAEAAAAGGRRAARSAQEAATQSFPWGEIGQHNVPM